MACSRGRPQSTQQKWQKQMPLMAHILDHPQSRGELEVISAVIDTTPTICEYIVQDLNKGKSESQRAGAKDMSADQVLRCVIVKILFGFTYKDLAFHMVGSQSLRWFCRIGMAREGFKKSALNRNIKVISDQTWQMINRDILGYAKQEGIEKGRKVRTNCTCVASNIHQPWDSNQLGDCVRVLTRLITRSRDAFGLKAPGFCNPNRYAKRRMLAVINAKNEKQRNAAYSGIESGISRLKRCMGLSRCICKGWQCFKFHVWSSIVAANLLTIARARLAPTYKGALGFRIIIERSTGAPKNRENGQNTANL